MIPAGRHMALLALLAPVVAVTAGCQSTQSKSAELLAELGPVKKEKGLEIRKESEDVEVLDTALLHDANGTAVVVTVKNQSDQTLADVPILINVLDAKGKSIYRNDIPGIETALAYIPILKPGETLDWVNNQVLAVGQPKEVKVEVGADARTYPGAIPDVEVSEPSLETDQVSGINAAGTVVNHTAEQQERILIYGVARRGDEIVAAGRAAVERANPERRRYYHLFFIGDPEGADLSISSFPTLPTSTEAKGANDG